MIKGRVAEAIIKELFHVNGYRVYNYGMENTLPQAVDNVKYKNDEIAVSVRQMPDYLVQHIESGELNYVEVKYRASGQFDFSDVKKNPYLTTCFVIISKENIQWITFKDLANGQTLPAKADKNVENCPFFHLNNELVAEYKAYARTFFDGIK